MAGLILLPPRFNPAVDADGDPISGARWYINQNLTQIAAANVYLDIALTTHAPYPLIADAGGAFPPVFAANNSVFSVQVTDATGASLPGSAMDNLGVSTDATTAAAQAALAAQVSAAASAQLAFFNANLAPGALKDLSNASYQLGTTAVPVTDALQRTDIYVDRFRLPGDPDDTASFVRALALPAPATLRLRARDYLVSDLITVNGAYRIAGDMNGGSRIVQTNLTKGGVLFQANFGFAAGISHVSITSNVATGNRGSSGVGLAVAGVNDGFSCDNFQVSSFDTGIEVRGGYNPEFHQFSVLYFNTYGIHLAPYTGPASTIAGTRWSGGVISNFGFGNVTGGLSAAQSANSVGLCIEQGSGEFFNSNIDITACGIGVLVSPPTGSFARFLRFDNVLADTSYYEGWLLDGTAGGYILDVECVACWFASSGGGAYRPAGSARGAGLVTKGTLDDVRIIGGTMRDNDCGGWDHQGGTAVRMVGTSIARNSRRVGSDNTYPGIRVRAGVSAWSLESVRSGNFALGVFNVSQAEGLVIDAGATDSYAVVNCDLSNPGAGKASFANGATGLNYTITGNRPRGTAGLNTSEALVQEAATSTGLPTNFTIWLGSSGQENTFTGAAWRSPRARVVTRLTAYNNTAPGAGQTYSVILDVNGSPSAMAGTISNGQFKLDVTGSPVTIPADVPYAVRLTSSSGAAPTLFQVALELEP